MEGSRERQAGHLHVEDKAARSGIDGRGMMAADMKRVGMIISCVWPYTTRVHAGVRRVRQAER